MEKNIFKKQSLEKNKENQKREKRITWLID